MLADKVAAGWQGYSPSISIRGAVRPAFLMADDDLIRKNYLEFQLATVRITTAWTREGITRKQESF